jgi:uncharacterized repeat protein (TIGR03803 family)
LYTFTGGADGGQPLVASLIFDPSGNLYGVTQYGGAYNQGTVFELTPSPSGTWTETVLYSFTGGTDGSNPEGGLIIDGSGNLYGTASQGGASACGTVFELSPSEGGWTFTVLHTFGAASYTDGCSPMADLTGLITGTTAYGGPNGQGTVFSMETSGSYDTVWTFPRGGGSWPSGGVNGWGLGVTAYGGHEGAGSIYDLYGSGRPIARNLHSFARTGNGGAQPIGDLIMGPGGNWYGTTSVGGVGGGGSVFQLERNGYTWATSLVYSFPESGEDGFVPFAGLAADSAGNLYGTTTGGGPAPGGDGVVFKLTPQSERCRFPPCYKWTETVLYSFTGGADGGEPYSPVVLDSAGNLYGTTYQGGIYNQGVVYEVTPAAATTTTLASAPNPSAYGQAATFTAAVASNSGAPPNGGTVSFMRGTKVLGTGTLSGGSATFTTSTLKMGTMTVKAEYGGDPNLFFGSTSNAVTQVVSQATTTTTLTSSLNPSNVGQSVTFTASVAPQFGGKLIGTVSFYDGTTLLRTVGVGAAKYKTKTLTSGTHTITATYNGSTSFSGSSASLTQTVN